MGEELAQKEFAGDFLDVKLGLVNPVKNINVTFFITL